MFLFLRCEKLRNELKLKEETWTERQEFYNKKIEEATKAVSSMKNKLDRQNALVGTQLANAASTSAANFDVTHAKGQLIIMQRKNAALQIELRAVELELKSKTMLEEQKSKLIEMLDKKVGQVNQRNKDLAEKIDRMKQQGETAAEGKEGELGGEEKQNLLAKTLDLTERLEYSQKIEAQLRLSNQELRKMLADLEHKGVNLMDLAKEKIKKYSDENKQLKADIEGMKTEGNDDQVKEVKNLLHAAEKEKSEIAQEKKDLEAKLNALSESIVNKEETNIEMMNEVLKIRESLAATEEARVTRQCEAALSALEAQNADLRADAQCARDELERVSREKAVLDEQMKTLKAVLNPVVAPPTASDAASSLDAASETPPAPKEVNGAV